MDNRELLDHFLKELDSMEHIKVSQIPDIDLYMDQVTTFMEQCLGNNRRYDEDKVLTKTMINNYTKNNLLPPPEKKKYSRNHLLLLIYIYYFKSFMSITDIETILNPIRNFWEDGTGPDFSDIYSEIFSYAKSQMFNLKKDLSRKFKLSEEAFCDLPDGQREELQKFTFLCMLGFDIYLKKQMMEEIIDDMKIKKD